MIKAVFFDLDGVLVDACDFHYKALNKALGFTISREEHETRYNGLSTKKKLALLADQGQINPEQIETIWNLKQQYTEEYINDLSLDHIKIAMHLLLREKNIEVACVTNAIRKTAELMLNKTGQLNFMSFIVSNEDVERNKPHPDPYIFAMNRAALQPDEVVIIEDSDVGYRSAIQVTPNVLKVKDSQDVNAINIVKALRQFNLKNNE